MTHRRECRAQTAHRLKIPLWNLEGKKKNTKYDGNYDELKKKEKSLLVFVRLITRRIVAATFTDASDQVSGNILVVDPPGGQMENYISRGPLAERKEQTKIYFKIT